MSASCSDNGPWDHFAASLPKQLDRVAGYSVKCAPDAPVLPGCEDPKALLKLFTCQQVIMQKLAEYGCACTVDRCCHQGFFF